MLGFDSDKKYTIYQSRLVNIETVSKQIALFPPDTDAGCDYFLVYCDVIEPQIFGSQSVNLLDAFSFQDSHARGAQPLMYKSLNTNILDKISIKITDQFGRLVSFEGGRSVTAILHIRPKL